MSIEGMTTECVYCVNSATKRLHCWVVLQIPTVCLDGEVMNFENVNTAPRAYFWILKNCRSSIVSKIRCIPM